jgi:uncharacterized protein YjbI with pentapeptide repeats
MTGDEFRRGYANLRDATLVNANLSGADLGGHSGPN